MKAAAGVSYLTLVCHEDELTEGLLEGQADSSGPTPRVSMQTVRGPGGEG